MEFIHERKRHWGDRKDGHWCKDAPAMNVIMTSLWPKRTFCEVSSKKFFDITNLLKYIEKKREENPNRKITVFHCFIAALTRVLNERRLLNRFVGHSRIYERDKILISFVAKRQFNDEGKEVMVTYEPKGTDNVESVSAFVNGEVTTIRKEDDKKKKAKDANNAIETVAKMPRWIINLVTRTMRVLDYYGHVPKSISQGDCAFSTVLLSNLGSIKSASCYHHLNNYGTNSIMMTIGCIGKRQVFDDEGNAKVIDVLEVTGNLDERIADGFYFIKSMNLLGEYLKHPESLDLKFEEDYNFEEAK